MTLQPTFEGLLERMLDAPQPEGIPAIDAMSMALKAEFPNIKMKRAKEMAKLLDCLTLAFLAADLDGSFK